MGQYTCYVVSDKISGIASDTISYIVTIAYTHMYTLCVTL